MSDFGETTHHVGYKTHRCEWCGEEIPKGERFAHYKGMWQDEWQNWRMHEECYDAMTDMPYYDILDGWEPHSFLRGSTESK